MAGLERGRYGAGGELGPHERAWREQSTVVVLTKVAPEPVEWLWPGRVPLGKLTVLDGDPGVGKSTVMLDLAARVSRGAPLADGTRADLPGPTRVVLLASEDGLADTIQPRLDAAGADLSRIVAITGVPGANGPRPLILPRDWLAVAGVLARVQARLLIVDPLMAYLDRGVNPYRDQDARQALAPLSLLAEKTRSAVVLLRHLTKAGRENALYRGGGSIGIIGVARSGLFAARDPTDPSGERRVLAVSKGNLADSTPALAYRLARTEGRLGLHVEWLGPVECGLQELVRQSGGASDSGALALGQARAFLEAILAAGRQPTRKILAAAAEAGIAQPTLRRAKAVLQIVAERDGYGADGGWWWRLPDQQPPADTWTPDS